MYVTAEKPEDDKVVFGGVKIDSNAGCLSISKRGGVTPCTKLAIGSKIIYTMT